jgi:uncharacterized protein
VIPAVEVDRIRTEMIATASLRPALELVVLFGSVAKKRATERSDIDVAIRCAAACDLDALYMDLAPLFRTDRLDLVDLRRAGPILSFAIARDGVVLFERESGMYRQFQSLASRRYADTAKLRKAQERAIAVFVERSERS